MCVSSSMSIHRPGEQVIGHFIAVAAARAIITSISASECVAVFQCVNLHVCKRSTIDLLMPDLSNIPFKKIQAPC